MPIGGRRKKESLLGALSAYTPGAVKKGDLVEKGEAIQDQCVQEDLLKVPLKWKI